MKIKRTGSLLAIVAGLMLGGCAAFQPSPVVLKNQVEPVMRTEGAAMSADHHYQAGRSAMRAGDLRSARKFFSQALLQDPNYIDAINAMAAILTVQGRYSDSLELMRQAVERAPDNAMFRRNLDRVERMVAREAGRPPAPVAGVAGVVAESAAPATVREAAGPAAVVTLAEAGQVAATTPDHTAPGASVDAAPAVVEVAPNVYQLRLPEHRVATAPQATRPEPVADAAPASGGRVHASPATALSAPWARASRPPAVPVADEAGKPSAAGGALTNVSYDRNARAPGPVRIMVTNGMGREGWAARHAGLLGAMGMTPARITNHRHYGVEQTLIRYRKGLLPEAERITGAVATLGNAKLVADDDLPAGIDLQVILGQDSQPVRHRPRT